MYRVIGIIESRAGDVAIMPDWSVAADPDANSFSAHADAVAVRDAMQLQIEKRRAERLAQAPGVGGASGPSISYHVLPVIDRALLAQLHGTPPPAVPAVPALSFGSQPSPRS